jgi:hypothetical protein
MSPYSIAVATDSVRIWDVSLPINNEKENKTQILAEPLHVCSTQQSSLTRQLGWSGGFDSLALLSSQSITLMNTKGEFIDELGVNDVLGTTLVIFFFCDNFYCSKKVTC